MKLYGFYIPFIYTQVFLLCCNTNVSSTYLNKIMVVYRDVSSASCCPCGSTTNCQVPVFICTVYFTHRLMFQIKHSMISIIVFISKENPNNREADVYAYFLQLFLFFLGGCMIVITAYRFHHTLFYHVPDLVWVLLWRFIQTTPILHYHGHFFECYWVPLVYA